MHISIPQAVYERPCRLTPTTFEADDPALQAYPRPLEWYWATLEQSLMRLQSQGVLLRLPIFWQLEPLVHAACRACGIPLLINETANMPVGRIALRMTGIDTVLTEARDATAFAAHLRQHKEAVPRAWVVIHRADDEWQLPALPSSARLEQEVHLMPGMPILRQCAELASRKASQFHLCEGYHIEDGLISSEFDEPAPLKDIPLSFTPVHAGVCTCGEQLWQPQQKNMPEAIDRR